MFDSSDSVEGTPGGGAGLAGAGTGRDVAGAVALLSSGVEALSSVPVGELPDAALSALFEALDPVLNRLDAARAALAGVWDGRVVWAADGARSGAGWLASHTESSRSAAVSLLAVARALRAMPETAAAFASGELGFAKVRLLAGARREAPEMFDRQEELLVGLVGDLRVDEAARVLAFWAQYANPDGAAAAAERRHAARGVELSQTIGGVWVLSGQLTAEQGEIVRTQLDPIVKRLHAADLAAVEAGDLVHWIHGGPTDLSNLALLCVHHHHRVHEGGFTVERLADGTLEFRRPDGTPLTVPKQRAPDPHHPPMTA